MCTMSTCSREGVLCILCVLCLPVVEKVVNDVLCVLCVLCLPVVEKVYYVY